MLPPELQPRSFRPYISSSSSAPSFSFSNSQSQPSSNPSSTESNLSSRSHGQQRGHSASPASSSSSRSIKNPSGFAHNYRIAMVLVPSAMFLLDLGGAPVASVLVVGLMISYILDSVVTSKVPSFFGVWLTLVFSQLCFFLFASPALFATFSSSVPLTLLSSFLCAHTTFLVGVWCSLNFRFLPLENPSIALTLERLLFASAPISASSIFTWATVSALYASTRGALWWVSKNENQVHSIRVVNGAVALVAVVVALEVRVVFHSFGRYIQVPPPLNYVLVTITMLGGAAAAGSYAMGMVSDALSSVAFTTSAIVVSAAGAVVIGFPVLVSSFVFNMACFLIADCVHHID
ncbi:hypothetical protein PIB30_003359 [Stylosanthes scabra]|uniref:Uncharacterized protein n=1 Tax=Stylosanthes scabra TaxID=79078 RepID=A0ABU6T4A6_9FABA|nr:hypothetical protein [Stylosanthes scabra]